MPMDELMTQTAEFPQVLADLVAKLTYRPGWTFHLLHKDRGQGSVGLTLDIITMGWNSYHRPVQSAWSFVHGDTCADCGQPFPCEAYIVDEKRPDHREPYRVHHYKIVPAAAYNEVSWRRWILDQIIEVERHEACEFLTFDDVKPYAPVHAPGYDPYIVFDVATDEAKRTSFRGVVKD